MDNTELKFILEGIFIEKGEAGGSVCKDVAASGIGQLQNQLKLFIEEFRVKNVVKVTAVDRNDVGQIVFVGHGADPDITTKLAHALGYESVFPDAIPVTELEILVHNCFGTTLRLRSGFLYSRDDIKTFIGGVLSKYCESWVKAGVCRITQFDGFWVCTVIGSVSNAPEPSISRDIDHIVDTLVLYRSDNSFAEDNKSEKKLLFRRCYPDYTSRDGFKYPKEGWVEAKDYNTKEECGGGLHALRVGDDLDNLHPPVYKEGLWQVFTDYESLIELKDKVKIRKGFVKTGIDITAYREEFLKSPEWACWYALDVDKRARDDTRKAACGDSEWAYEYARYVDRCVREDTREAACGNPEYAYWYALTVDRRPSDETRKAACGHSEWAYRYALNVDKCARDDTREAACGNPEYAYMYARYVDICSSDETRRSACRDPFFKKKYQEWEESLSKK